MCTEAEGVDQPVDAGGREDQQFAVIQFGEAVDELVARLQ
jgi:hypothetical protein